MPESPGHEPVRLSLPGKQLDQTPLPRMLQSASRGGGGDLDPFVNDRVVATTQVFDLTPASRAATVAEVQADIPAEGVLALEMEDGFTLFIRADKPAEDLARIDPDAIKDGALHIDALRDRSAPTRGIADWLVTRLSVLQFKPDDIIDAALAKAREWLGGTSVGPLPGWAELSVTWLGTKALMWAIEQRLGRVPGLYRWSAPQGDPTDPLAAGDAGLKQDAAVGPILVFIHGTGLSTVGSFADLRSAAATSDWSALAEQFGERIYAFEHRTLSESPIENALQLATVLPAGARVNIVTHSRGGLVGDLLCLAGVDEALLNGFRRRPGLEQADAEDRRHLRELRSLLEAKNFRIERYVRVASPARGTRLASGNFDAFLSGLLSLIGLVPVLQASPLYSAFKRVVLEIARNRTKPDLVPGIEAMLPESPLGALLAQAHAKQGTRLAVIAGDIEGGGLLKRLGVFFTDYMLFDQQENDLVVDTDSMYQGLARGESSRYLYDQGPEVSHFHYFINRRSRRAVKDWLTLADPDQAADFAPVAALSGERSLAEEVAADAARGTRAQEQPRPVVFVIPGIMGSHLAIAKDRVWFDFFDLAAGGLEKIRWPGASVSAEKLFDMFYEDLCRHLSATHEVRRFPYDWRKSVRSAAAELARQVDDTLDSTDQPVRLLAHSMGGLVVRAMIADPAGRQVWDKLAARNGARFVMLGTPNRGSHLMVETLLGKAQSVRRLARVDLAHGLQGVLDIVGEFRGALELLPRPDFADSGSPAMDYFAPGVWQGFKSKNRDFWFGDRVAGTSGAGALGEARALWTDTLKDEALPNPDRIAYVFGCAANTPCGVVEEGERLKIVGTPRGDGSVTWDSGRLPGITHCWYMPVEHGALADSETHFPALVDLLERGATDRLSTTEPAVRGVAQRVTYDAGPMPYPTQEELARGLLGAKPRLRRRKAQARPLRVECRAMDLRFAQLPIMCGHYEKDPISAAEAQIDRYVVDGALTLREHLGLYAGPVGSSTVALQAQNDEERRRGSTRGAVIVGLGTLGELTTSAVAEAARAGVLRYLLHIVDAAGGVIEGSEAQPREVGLATLLIGYNSTTNIGIEDSVAAIVRGVCEANRQFAEAMHVPLRVGQLQFVELYLDTAVTTAYAVRRVAQRMEREWARLGSRIEAAPELIQGDGVRERLNVSASGGYWPRLMVTDADRSEPSCPPETAAAGKTAESRIALAQRLRFIFLSQRARAESVAQQCQPGLIEKLVDKSIANDQFQPELSRTLFQLMVPLDFKETARQLEHLVLVLDGYTANLPWEMLIADEKPLVLQTALVRQLASSRFRARIRSTTDKTAYVVGDPSTSGFEQTFGEADQPESRRLPALDGAAREAQTVATILESRSYQVEKALSGSEALEVINKLFKRPYRLLHIAAHGIYDVGGRDGVARSGVVLSDGLLLTAAEVAQMEIVPELVFLNCCYLGKVDRSPVAVNRLAYSLARELIEMGVRAVVTAGWAVNDEAATTFAASFYTKLLDEGLPFGHAVFQARRETHDRHPNCNTWGAYQAYGDPGFVVDPAGGAGGVAAAWQPVTPRELIDRLRALRTEASAGAVAGSPRKRPRNLDQEARELLKDAPAAWAEMPEVQYALGALWGELGHDYFGAACAAYGAAINAEDKAGRVPMRTIEQLANLEARVGESTQNVELIDHAINRIEALLHVGAATDGRAPPPPGNRERCALLGSAYKRKAACLARAQHGWPEVKDALAKCVQWYQAGEGRLDEPDFDPYGLLNRLTFQAVAVDAQPDADATAQRVALTQRCAEIARVRFARSGGFFDAIMPADAQLAAALLRGSIGDEEQALIGAYEQAGQGVPQSARQFDSVLKQLRFLAELLALRAQAQRGDDAQRNADSLGRIADALARWVGASAASAGASSAHTPLADQALPPAADAPAAKADRPRPAPAKRPRGRKKP